MRGILRRVVKAGRIWLLAAAIRLALWILPFGAVRRLVVSLGQKRTAGVPPARSAEVLAWQVRRVAAYVPRASCLTQALAAQVLLTRAGYTPSLRIGFVRGPGGEVHAHAWLENAGKVVIGGEPGRFAPLPAMGDR